jgi:uncharacterized membrane protein SpoIIM required for sporulation
MREAMFIKKNAEKWKTYQHQQTENPDETAERFITLIDDLSYAKTFYPKSKVTRWINGIAATIYQSIYRNKKEKYRRIFQFWKFELPLLFKKYQRVLLFTTLIFSLFVAIGYFSSAHDPSFVRGVLGDDYVNETEDRIASGDPFGVYSNNDQTAFNMFVWIAFNNIGVAFKTFAGGFTLGIFTLMLMWSNGIMLGSFQHLFFSNGLGMKSILVIWIHGTIEISSIVIAGTAGFVLANGILFPGTYPRMTSFKRGAKDAAKILISLVPFFITAAFLESYITRFMSRTYEKGQQGGMPVWVSILILAASLFLIIWYFVILPIKLNRRGFFIKQDGIVSRLNETNA